jgi:hypothetical protein
MAKDKDEPTLTTLQRAPKKHGVPYTSMRDLVLQGHLPAVKLGDSRRIWVKNADVDRLIASSTDRKKK